MASIWKVIGWVNMVASLLLAFYVGLGLNLGVLGWVLIFLAPLNLLVAYTIAEGLERGDRIDALLTRMANAAPGPATTPAEDREAA